MMSQSDNGEPQVDDPDEQADPDDPPNHVDDEDAPGAHIDDDGGPLPEPNEPA